MISTTSEAGLFEIGNRVKYENTKWDGSSPPPDNYFGWHFGTVSDHMKNKLGQDCIKISMEDGGTTFMLIKYATGVLYPA